VRSETQRGKQGAPFVPIERRAQGGKPHEIGVNALPVATIQRKSYSDFRIDRPLSHDYLPE
jgi:hypothetical protein